MKACQSSDRCIIIGEGAGWSRRISRLTMFECLTILRAFNSHLLVFRVNDLGNPFTYEILDNDGNVQYKSTNNYNNRDEAAREALRYVARLSNIYCKYYDGVYVGNKCSEFHCKYY